MKTALRMAKCTVVSCLLLFLVFPFTGCGSGDESATSPFQVVGELSQALDRLQLPSSIGMRAAASYGDPSLCPDQTGGGVSANLSPTAYTVALKKMTLLGAEGTADFELFSASSLDQAYTADFVADPVFFASDTFPDPGTYTGIRIEVYYVEMSIPMILPAVFEDEASYRTRGYFAAVGNIVKRDVTVFVNDAESWIDRKTDSVTAFEPVAVTSEHPDQVLDLWADDAFWLRDPVTISTADTEFGNDFTFRMADGSGNFVIPENPPASFTITLSFDVANKFTFWEFLPTLSNSEADGKFKVGYDCGYRIMFPNVLVSAG
ncbi:MAG: hypothetical protein V1798_07170 [Pseudomonadota bacterium]